MSAKKSTRSQSKQAYSVPDNVPATKPTCKELLEDAQGQIFQAQASVRMVGYWLTNCERPDEEECARASLSLAGAEALLDLAANAVDVASISSDAKS